jgi:hypothetical protein
MTNSLSESLTRSVGFQLLKFMPSTTCNVASLACSVFQVHMGVADEALVPKTTFRSGEPSP